MLVAMKFIKRSIGKVIVLVFLRGHKLFAYTSFSVKIIPVDQAYYKY